MSVRSRQQCRQRVAHEAGQDVHYGQSTCRNKGERRDPTGGTSMACHRTHRPEIDHQAAVAHGQDGGDEEGFVPHFSGENNQL